MENKMMVITESAPTVGYETQPAPINQFQPYPAYDEKQMGKLIDEVRIFYNFVGEVAEMAA